MHVAMIDIINELVKNNKEQKAEIRLLKQQQQQHLGRASGGEHPDDVDDKIDFDLALETLETKLDVLMELDPRKSTILRNSTKMMMSQSSPENIAMNHTIHKDCHNTR